MASHRTLLGDLRAILREFAGDAGRLARVRGQMLRFEGRLAARQIERLLFGMLAALLLATAGAALALAAVAERLQGWGGLSRAGWLGLFGLAAAGLGIGLGWRAWRRFRREFRGFQASVAELQEDLCWLREWVERPADDPPPE